MIQRGFRSKKSVAIVIVAAWVFVGVSEGVNAQQYQFSVVADTTTAFAQLIGPPSGSNSGNLAFVAQRADGTQALVAGKPGSLRVVAETGTAVPEGNDTLASFFNTVSVNESGQVAFVATLAGGGNRLFVSRSERLESVPVPFTTAEQLQTPVISSSGAITFWSAGPGCHVSEGLYRWHRGRLTPIVEVPCSGPHPSGIFAIDNEHDQNAGGDVAVIGAIDSNGTQNRLFVFRRGTAVGIAGPAECPSINNGGDVVSSDDGVTSSACPSLNDPGELAYSTGSEIRTTEGPSQQHVIGIGDGLSGSTISSLFQLRPHSLNNRGDIVFAVELADGRQAVVVASKQ